MILGPTYKCQSAIDAINHIKALTKREVITFKDIIPPPSRELKEKVWYMKQDEFINNPENKKMLDWGEELAKTVKKIIKVYGY